MGIIRYPVQFLPNGITITGQSWHKKGGPVTAHTHCGSQRSVPLYLGL